LTTLQLLGLTGPWAGDSEVALLAAPALKADAKLAT